ncbi:MAG: hypothetical protein RLZZ403_81, partial [Pseudomonadota bacterium]
LTSMFRSSSRGPCVATCANDRMSSSTASCLGWGTVMLSRLPPHFCLTGLTPASQAGLQRTIAPTSAFTRTHPVSIRHKASRPAISPMSARRSWRKCVSASDAGSGRASIRDASTAGLAPFACAGMGVQEDGRASRTVAGTTRSLAAVFEMAIGALATRGIRAPCKRQARCFFAQIPGFRLLACLAAGLASDNPNRSPRVPQRHRDRRSVELRGGVGANQFLEPRDEALQQTGRQISRSRSDPPRCLGGQCRSRLVGGATHWGSSCCVGRSGEHCRVSLHFFRSRD